MCIRDRLVQAHSNKVPSSPIAPSVDLEKFWVAEWGLHGRGPFGCSVPRSPANAHLILAIRDFSGFSERWTASITRPSVDGLGCVGVPVRGVIVQSSAWSQHLLSTGRSGSICSTSEWLNPVKDHYPKKFGVVMFKKGNWASSAEPSIPVSRLRA